MNLFTDSIIWVGSPPRPVDGWLAFEGGQIHAIEQADRAPPSDAVPVGNRRHIIPGFVDCHSHLSSSAFLPMALDGAEITDVETLLGTLAQWSEGMPANAWVVVFNLDWSSWKGARAPSARTLDDAASGRPVLLADISLHRGVLSETGLELCGIDGIGADLLGDVDHAGGRPTGVVWEAAFGKALSLALSALAARATPEELDALLDEEARRHLSFGITDVHEPGVPVALAPRLERLRTRTPLRISWSATGVAGMMSVPEREDLEMSYGAANVSAKLFLDGAHRCAMCLTPGTVLKVTAAAFLAAAKQRDTGPLQELLAYRAAIRGRHVHLTYLRFDMPNLLARIDMLGREGATLRIHALGNLAARQAVEAMAVAAPGVRATIEHLSLLSDHDLDAVALGGHVAAIQPGFIPQYGPHMRSLGVIPALRGLPAKSLADRGITLAISSDNPCGPLDSLHNLRMAVDRGHPGKRPFEDREALSQSDALAAATLNGAVAIHGAAKRGLEAGGPADFAVIDGNPFTYGSRVAETWIGGECVWRRRK